MKLTLHLKYCHDQIDFGVYLVVEWLQSVVNNVWCTTLVFSMNPRKGIISQCYLYLYNHPQPRKPQERSVVISYGGKNSFLAVPDASVG
jgi:hypothetical protein